MYILKITGLTPQQNQDALIKTLLQVPGLNSQRISTGLRVPPLVVFSAKEEQDMQDIKELKSTLERFGARCEIEKAVPLKPSPIIKKTIPAAENKNKYSYKFWIAVIAVIAFFFLVERISSADSSSTAQTPKTKEAEKKEKPAQQAPKKTNELKSDLSRNPYNTSAWKALYENLERVGDTASARRAKESYEKALRAQMVLASLAKAFGNDARAEVTEDAVYYRTSKDLTDSEFYHEAEKLRETMSARFPGRDLIVENYTSDNKVQTVRLKSGYNTVN